MLVSQRRDIYSDERRQYRRQFRRVDIADHGEAHQESDGRGVKMAEVSVREVDSIIQNLVSLKDDIRELKQEVKDFILQMEHRLDNLDELLQVHNGRNQHK